MKLTVFVHDTAVATLDSPDGFGHVLSYYPTAKPEQFTSLLMPVRTQSYDYPELHPLFRMNLPEGFLLSVLQERLGPHIGASPLNLLSVVGRNAIGRVKVAPEGADPKSPPLAFEVRNILRGDNSEQAFMSLVREFAVSGVSGVVPKFLAPAAAGQDANKLPGKTTLATEKFIVKGTPASLPEVALNEHFCMQVAQRAFGNAAKTEVSDDAQALVVHRFDYEEDGQTRLGMEDLCSLLSLRPEQKYDATWERVVKRIRVRGGFKPWGAAVSALEMALWDIAGKAANLPVYRLLGGKVRDQVRTYRTLYHHEVGIGHTPEDYVKWAEYGKALPGGFTMFKLPTSFHSSMVRDFPDFHYGAVQHDAPFPYPHKGLISEGGGVFPRSAKSITLSPQARAVIGTEASAMAPNRASRRT